MTDSSFEIVQGRPTIDKDPDADLIYGLDLLAWSASAGDTVVGASATAGGTLVVGTPSVSSGIVTARVSGGTVGHTSPVTFTWQTAGGSTDQRTIWLRIVQR